VEPHCDTNLGGKAHEYRRIRVKSGLSESVCGGRVEAGGSFPDIVEDIKVRYACSRGCRVEPGGYPPRTPTDPDLPDFRYAASGSSGKRFTRRSGCMPEGLLARNTYSPVMCNIF
jgi:hypothetical protein